MKGVTVEKCEKCPVKRLAGGFYEDGEACVRCKAGKLPDDNERTEAEE